MKIIAPCLLGCLLLLGAGCSTLGSRISASQEAFNSWPTEVQDKVLAGQADVGFTPEQVHVALGEPQRKYTRKTEAGTAEVWAYAQARSGLSLGLGMGSWRGGRSYGGGVVYDTSAGRYDDERMRVVFQDGRVTSIEVRTR